MGARFEFETIHADDDEELVEAVETMIEDAVYVYGDDGYTGTWAEVNGVELHGEIELNRHEAEGYIMANARKWESAIAVRAADKLGAYYVGAWCSI